MRFIPAFLSLLPVLWASGIEYSRPDGTPLLLDAHTPPGKGPFPAVILVHGGGWSHGDRNANFIQPLFGPLTEGGFSWFSIDYRLAPKYPWSAAAEDVESAVRFVKQHAAEYKVDPGRIALMGESAGAHLVNVVGAKNNVGVAAVVCLYGPMDMIQWAKERLEGKPLTPVVKAVFGIESLDKEGMEKIRESSPAIYINPKTPPFLFIHGTKDEAVEYSQATLGMKLLQEHHIACELITVPDGAHGVINWQKEERFQLYKKPMITWLQKTLGKRSRDNRHHPGGDPARAGWN